MNEALTKIGKTGLGFLKKIGGWFQAFKLRFSKEEDKNEYQKRILVFSRLEINNFGDPIIADCCRYLIDKVAKENNIRIKTTIADIYEINDEVMKSKLKNQDAVVFPGGGLNSIKFNRIVQKVLDMIAQQPYTSVFFNAIGILRVKPRKKNIILLKDILNRPQVKQISTRGDLVTLKKYIKKKEYPTKLVLDPAVWVNEAYGIERDKESKIVGVGVIRPEIFERNGSEMSVDDILKMYVGIISELEKRGYRWKLFTNGMKDDYKFGLKVLEELSLDKETYMGDNVKNCRQLVEKIAGFQAVIAARLHANIISTSLDVPSVGLVWNDKMNLFAGIIGAEKRYIEGEKLLDSSYVVDQMEEAIQNGYDMQKINRMKRVTLKTIKNIVMYGLEENGQNPEGKEEK